MNIATLLLELRANATIMSLYLQSISDYLFSGTGTPPEFETVSATFKVDDTQQYSQEISSGENGYSSGVVSMALYDTTSVQREADMVAMRKADFYTQEIAGLNAQADNVGAELARHINYLQGNSPEQNMAI
jgi:hypothetical protein